MRYVEIDGQLRKILMVIKMRGGAHSKDIREYDITLEGIVIGERIRDYAHLITGIPELVNAPIAEARKKQIEESEVLGAKRGKT